MHRRQVASRVARRGPASDASRDRIFAAAAKEFAARGFAGGSVDRIALAARLNKAMIYYHFRSQAALYAEILRDMFGAVRVRVHDVAASTAAPEEKIRQFVEAIAAAAEARPHFPPIWFREIADGATHLDDATVRDIAGIVKTLAAIITEGVSAGRFHTVNPLLVHGGIVGPLLLFFVSAPLRRRIERGGVRGASTFARDEVVTHVQQVTLGVLEGRM